MTPDLRSTLLQVVPFAVGLLLLAVAIRRGRVRTADIGLHPPVRRGAGWWVVGFAGYSLGVEALVYYCNHQQLPVAPWAYSWPIVLLRATGILLLAPLAEEILLRGILLALLRRRRVPMYAAIGLQALVFTLLHFGALSASLAGNLSILQIFVDGVLFGLARYQTGSLYPTIAMHVLGNAIAVAERLPR